MKKTTSILFISILLIGISAFSPPGQRYFEIAKHLDIFASLFKEVNKYYVDDVNPNLLMRTGVDGMLNSLIPTPIIFPKMK